MIRSRTVTFVVATAALAVLFLALAAVLLPAASQDEIEAAVFFGLATFVAHGMAYRLPRGGFGNIAFVPLLSGAAVVPAFPIVLGTAVALLIGEYFRRRETIRIVFNASQLTIAVAGAVFVYRAVGGTSVSEPGTHYVLPFVVAFATFFLSNASLFAGVVASSSDEKFFSVLARTAGGSSLVYDLVGIPIVLAFAFAYVRLGWGWSGALLLPLVGIRQVYKANRELQTVNEELLQLMVAAIEARDPYTSGHSQRVATYARIVAHAAGVSARNTERVYTAALLHDVGKIHEEFASILRKPGRLTDDEFTIMKSHAPKGAALVARVSQFADIVPAIRGHHEAWNGSGYPDGLNGEQIPFWSRIIAIADTIDAMTTDRPYREALGPDAVRAELIAQLGRQFDPRVAASLIQPSDWPRMERAIAAFKPDRAAVRAAASRLTPRHSPAVAGPAVT